MHLGRYRLGGNCFKHYRNSVVAFIRNNGRLVSVARIQEDLDGRRFTGKLKSVTCKERIRALSCGDSHAVLLSEEGRVLCLDKANILSPLGNLCNRQVTQVACGDQHSILLTQDGQVFTWGQNTSGQLGLGWSEPRDMSMSPKPLKSLSGIPLVQITAGGDHSFALSLSGAVFGWGKNTAGQLGLGDTTNRCAPAPVDCLNLKKTVLISCGGEHTAVLTKGGVVFTFGSGRYGQLGHNSLRDELRPRVVGQLCGLKVTQIACGRHHTLAFVGPSNKIYSFGHGEQGQLGNGVKIDQSVPLPVQLPGKTFIYGITLGRVHAFSEQIKITQTCNCREITKMFSSASCLNGSFLDKRLNIVLYALQNLPNNRQRTGMWRFDMFLVAEPAPVFELRLNRASLIEDTFHQLSVYFDEDAKLTNVYKRDFFLHLFDKLLVPESGMFMYNDTNTLAWFPAMPRVEEKRYFLFGVLCGMALYNNNMVHLPFPMAFFKKLVNINPSLEDLREFSPIEAGSLQYILDYPDDDVENMDMTFSVCIAFKQKEFVDTYVNYIFNQSVEVVFEEFRKGFFKVCDKDVVEFFQPEELRGVMVGQENFDWETLKQNTVYEGEYHAGHPNIVTFWEVFEELTEDQKKAFLLFLTGCDRVPILGMNQIRMRVQTLLNSSQQHFPEALTCHSLLQLPIYSSKETLQSRLIEAVGHNRGFWNE
uniref:HECT domain-containing protein n=1 Tax=Oncorhynchus tshawytscha TaxID=74940 RepID=A0AAZ3RHT0_ONCTS